jgi:hypothetical protein
MRVFELFSRRVSRVVSACATVLVLLTGGWVLSPGAGAENVPSSSAATGGRSVSAPARVGVGQQYTINASGFTPGRYVELKVNGQTFGWPKVDVNGSASFTNGTWETGTFTIEARIDGAGAAVTTMIVVGAETPTTLPGSTVPGSTVPPTLPPTTISENRVDLRFPQSVRAGVPFEVRIVNPTGTVTAKVERFGLKVAEFVFNRNDVPNRSSASSIGELGTIAEMSLAERGINDLVAVGSLGGVPFRIAFSVNVDDASPKQSVGLAPFPVGVAVAGNKFGGSFFGPTGLTGPGLIVSSSYAPNGDRCGSLLPFQCAGFPFGGIAAPGDLTVFLDGIWLGTYSVPRLTFTDRDATSIGRWQRTEPVLLDPARPHTFSWRFTPWDGSVYGVSEGTQCAFYSRDGRTSTCP